MKSAAAELLVSGARWASLVWPMANGLHAHWFKRWTPALDDALAELPEMDDLPHDEYRMLATNPGPTEKRHAVVSEKGQVCGVVSLRRRNHTWEPVTALCIPTVIVPTRHREVEDVLRATSLDIAIPEFSGPPSVFPHATVIPFEVYGVDLTTDYERHWRENGYWKTIRSIRNRTSHLEVRVDEPSDLDWVIEQWVKNWEADPEQMALAAPDMRMMWKRMRDRARIQTIAVVEGDAVLAGGINLIEGSTIVGMCTARVADRPSYSLGTKLIDASFGACREMGYEHFDLGGWGNYKHRLAPVCGERYLVTINPPLVRAAHRSIRLASGVKRRVVDLGRKVAAGRRA